MPVGGVEKEVYSLLRQFGLSTLLTRLDTDRGDDSTLTQVILAAYIETKEPEFFGLYYMSTYPGCFERAKCYLKRVSSPVNPEDIISDAYSIFLKICLANRLGQIGNPTGYMNRIIQNLIKTKSAEHRKKHSTAGGEGDSNAVENLNPIDILITMEEDSRKELQHAYIQELLSGERDGLTELNKEVFIDFYINKKSAKSIALQQNTSMYNIYKMLYRVKRKIRTLTQSHISLEQVSFEQGEEEV